MAKIKGYKGIDDYVLHLIEHELESIRDGGQGIDDLGEYVIEYIVKIIGPESEEEEKKVHWGSYMYYMSSSLVFQSKELQTESSLIS